MKTRRIVLVLLAAGVIGLCAFLWPEPEPRYQGRKLSQWLLLRDSAPPFTRPNGLNARLASFKSFPAVSYGSSAETEDAIRHIGTNALPYLVKWIQYETP